MNILFYLNLSVFKLFTKFETVTLLIMSFTPARSVKVACFLWLFFQFLSFYLTLTCFDVNKRLTDDKKDDGLDDRLINANQ